MDLSQSDFSTIFQAKFFDVDVDNDQLWSDESETSRRWNVVDDESRRKRFSYLLQVFRIFLLVYHSVTWNDVLRTTGVSREQKYEELDVCD